MSGWFPVALSDDLELGMSAGTVLNGQDLVMWRDSRGVAHVWNDRCPHRGMRLSLGFLRDDQLACPYHGWRFDTEGQCRFIPAHPEVEVPRSVLVQRFASQETSAMIWVNVAGVVAEPIPGQDPEGHHPAGHWDASAVRTVVIHAAPARVQLNLSQIVQPASDLTDTALSLDGVVTSALTRIPYGAGELLIGTQPMDSHRTAVHLSVVGITDTEALVDIARGATRFRTAVEKADRVQPHVSAATT